MLNLSEVVALLENLASGKGVYLAGATGPYFVKADGSILDKDGVQVAKASALSKKYYDDYAGNFPLTGVVPAAQIPAPTSTTKGGVVAAPKGTGDTVVAKLGSDGKLYVPTYPTDAQYDMTAFMVEVDEVSAALPELPVEQDDGYKLADQATKKIYTLATVEETQSWGSGVALAAGKLYTNGTDVYVFGSGSLAKI